MKISTLGACGLLMAWLVWSAGAAAQADTVTPSRADIASAVTRNQASAAPATGTEADAAASGATQADDEQAAEWEAHEDQDEDAGRGSSSDHKHHASGRHHHASVKHDNEVVNVGGDSVLEAGKEADQVVSVFGNARAEGAVREDVVSVFGSTYVDGKIGGDAVAVFGNVELGPHAEIAGDVVTVFGKLRRDPAAIVHGDSQSVFAHDFAAPDGLRSWIDHCLLYGRPLSLAHGLGWAWGLALSLLVLYLGIALVSRSGVERCVTTFERHPGPSILAALLAVLLTPVLIVLLCITVVGIAAVPFTVIGLFCVALFGKAVILAWLGGTVLRVRGNGAPGAGVAGTVSMPHPALAVLLGGLIALALYLVPFFGFVFYKLLGFLGFGAVVYTVILALRARQAAKNGGVHAAGANPATVAGAMSGAGPTRDDAAVAAAPAAAASFAAAAAATGESTAPPGTAPPRANAPSSAAATSAALTELPRAGFWIRMAALLLDVLLVGLVTHLLHTFPNAHLVLLAAYGAIMWKLRGCTVGGIVFDLRVVRLDGRDVDWETAIIRALSCFLSLAVAGLGFFWIAFDPGNQAWHDKIAGTVVVRVPKAVPRT